MPLDTAARPFRDARAFAVPAALAGSIAVILGSSPAIATEQTADRGLTLRAVPTMSGVPLVALPRPASAVPETYTVVGGDSVSAIASRFGLRTADLLALNGLSWDDSVIRPGQVLRLTGAAPAAAAPAAPAASAGYTVVGGDTIIAIAQKHGVSTQAVLDANGLTRASIIYPGQALAIPGASTAPPAVAPAAPAPAPPTASVGYTVAAGDTISAIAQKHGSSTQAVLDANGLTRASIIYPGQTLAIPGAAVLASAPAPAPAAAPAPVAVGLDEEQTANARLIIQIGRELGIPDRGIAIALGTAMQESWIRNLDWGDRDSLGLFQQRPSSGWGTPEEIRDTGRSTRVFYGGAADPNGTRTRGLLDIPGWQNLSYAEAAQAVQISAHPDRYAQWEQPSYAWLAALG